MSNLFLQVNKDLFGSGLDPVALLVLSQVQEFHRNKAVCYMTDAEMAKNFGTSAKTISRRLDDLEAKGYIKRQSKYVGGKTQRTIVPVMKSEKDTADNLSITNKSADNLSPKLNETVEANLEKQLQADNLSSSADNLSISNRQNDLIKYNIKDKEEKINQDDLHSQDSSSLRSLSSFGVNHLSTEISRPIEEEEQEQKEQKEEKVVFMSAVSTTKKQQPQPKRPADADKFRDMFNANGSFKF